MGCEVFIMMCYAKSRVCIFGKRNKIDEPKNYVNNKRRKQVNSYIQIQSLTFELILFAKSKSKTKYFKNKST